MNDSVPGGVRLSPPGTRLPGAPEVGKRLEESRLGEWRETIVLRSIWYTRYFT